MEWNATIAWSLFTSMQFYVWPSFWATCTRPNMKLCLKELFLRYSESHTRRRYVEPNSLEISHTWTICSPWKLPLPSCGPAWPMTALEKRCLIVSSSAKTTSWSRMLQFPIILWKYLICCRMFWRISYKTQSFNQTIRIWLHYEIPHR